MVIVLGSVINAVWTLCVMAVNVIVKSVESFVSVVVKKVEMAVHTVVAYVCIPVHEVDREVCRFVSASVAVCFILSKVVLSVSCTVLKTLMTVSPMPPPSSSLNTFFIFSHAP